jgi:Brp/Blh family beta-carotene 15,15'-monooxygenase
VTTAVFASRRILLYPSWAIITALIVLAASGVQLEGWVAYLPFAISLVLLGLPHGAVDHLVPFRLRGEAVTVKPLLGIVVAYLTLSALYAVAWWLVPAASALFFILLTWFHWGQGELYATQRFIGLFQRAGWLQIVLTIAVRGSLPMLIPFLAFPDVYLGFLNEMTTAVSPTASIPLTLAQIQAWLPALWAAFGFTLAIYLSLGWRYASHTNQKQAWLTDAGEIMLLLVYFSLVPPVLAVGVYFCVWHSVRHIARLLLTDPPAARAWREGRLPTAIWKFMRDSWPLTVVSLLFLGALFVLLVDNPTDLRQLTAVYLVLISVLTLPHTVVVSWMDSTEGIWTPPAAPREAVPLAKWQSSTRN